jgi:MYXO-CTERM domain-containing protein
MRARLALAAGLLVSLAGRVAWSCGGGFGTGIAVNPQQDIIIVWKDGVETYVFQPIFCGTATDFGLILPVPSELSQMPALANQQAFTTAIASSEPKKVKVSSSSGIGCGSSASGGAMNRDSVPTVVASGRVGFLDWVQLKAQTEASFTDWLTANGYPYSTTSATVFSYYVQKGWYFLAFRISQGVAPDGGTLCTALGPIAFAFPTPTPVVPSRMAGAGSPIAGSSASLYAWRIFGISYGDVQLGSGSNLRYSGLINDSDLPPLAGLAQTGDRLTRLNITFDANTASADVDLGMVPASDYRATEYVPDDSDSVCSMTRTSRSGSSFMLPLFALVLAGLVCWRRRR